MSAEIGHYKVHPAADLFPLIQGAEFDALTEDIRAHGLMEPIMLDRDGQLIDGRNRLRACIRGGVEPRSTVYSGGDVIQFITSHNIHRRHLTESQRAMIAAELANLPWGGAVYANGGSKPPDGVSLSGPSAVTRSEAKSLMQVSEGSLQRAKVIQRQGTPELQALVKDSNIPLATAVRVSERAEEEQREYVEKVRAGANPVAESKPEPVPPRASNARDGRSRKHRKAIEAAVIGLSGYGEALRQITELDGSVTSEEAAQWVSDLSEAIGQFRRIQKLLRECTK